MCNSFSRLKPTAPCIARVLESEIEYDDYRLPPGVIFWWPFFYFNIYYFTSKWIFFYSERYAVAHGVGVSGRKQFQRRDLVQTGKVDGRINEKITIFGRTVRLWQTNVSGEAIRRTRTPNYLSKGQQNITFTPCFNNL